MEEYEFKSKLQQSEEIISRFKKPEMNNGVLQNNNKKREKLQTTIDGFSEIVDSLNQSALVLCEKQKQLQATIEGQTKTEETNNRTVQELRDNQKQLQATIDGLKKKVEALNQRLKCGVGNRTT